VNAAIEPLGSVDVPRWAAAVVECVSALERVAYAAPALAGHDKPPPRASLPPGASAGEVERRWAGPLYGRDAVTVVGRGSVVGRELVGWVSATDDGEGAGGGGGRRWLSGVFPSSARDIAARFTERVLRPSGQGWLHACVGAVVPGHASLLMDEDEVGEWEPLPEVPAYPLVSAWGVGWGVWLPLHTHVCVGAGGGRRGCGVAVAHARVGRCGGAVGQAGACSGGAAACGGASSSGGVAHGDRGGSDGGAGDAGRVRTSTGACTRTRRWRGRCRWRRGCSERWIASARVGSEGGRRQWCRWRGGLSRCASACPRTSSSVRGDR
jgi:hypothetical protein